MTTEDIVGGKEGMMGGKDTIILCVALPIVLLTLAVIAIRFCVISNRRHATMFERRQSLRALERAQIRENKRLAEQRKKKRTKEIEDALICKLASTCKCSKHNRRKTWSSELDITMHTNVTDDMSTASSIHEEDKDDNVAHHHAATCAICLEAYNPKDKVCWSKYQTCKHAFHKRCIEVWLAELERDGSCPCCRGQYLKAAADESEDSMNAAVNSGDDNMQVDIESCNESDFDETPSSFCTAKEVGLDFVSFCVVHGWKSIKGGAPARDDF